MSPHTLNKRSIFQIYHTNEENFIYAILAALYSNKADQKTFHYPSAYINYKKTLNLKNVSLPMKNKNIPHFLKNNHHLNFSIRLFDLIKTSNSEVQMYEAKIFGKGGNIINIMFYEIYKEKKTYYIYYWIKHLDTIKKSLSYNYVCTICYDRFFRKST